MEKSLKELWESRTDGRCHKWVHYFEIYERYMSKFRNANPTYLEIGVQQGGSLDLMREYFGQAKIIGIDIDPSCLQSMANGHDIFIGSQDNTCFLEDVAGKFDGFDIIVDDGGHTANQQITSFVTLFPHLKDGGVYIVEDLHVSQHWVGFQDSVLGINFLDYAKGLADKLSLWHMREDWFHNRYGQPLESRDNNGPKFNNFAVNQIFSISFYDSIIAIEKRAITEPYQTRK